jgi:hypothetical protein
LDAVQDIDAAFRAFQKAVAPIIDLQPGGKHVEYKD